MCSKRREASDVVGLRNGRHVLSLGRGGEEKEQDEDSSGLDLQVGPEGAVS